MNDGTLIRKNLFRKGLRTFLLIVSIFIAFLIFGVLVSFNAALSSATAAPDRMVTVNKINFTETLPMAYYDRIRTLPDVRVATHMNWFGGYYRDQQSGFLPVFAVDPESYLAVYHDDVPLTAAQRAAFLGERTAIIMSRDTAERFGWREGQRIPLQSNIYLQADGRRAWDFVIAAVYDAPEASSQRNSVIIHYDYFNETITFGRYRIGWVPFLTASASINDRVAHQIDALFANSPDETQTETAQAFNQAFIKQLGNIALVVTLVVGAAFAAILLIVGNTMVTAVRERTKEIGVMKTLGFTSGRIMRMVLSESLLLALIGAALGLGTAALFLVGASKAARGQFGNLHMEPSVALLGLAIAVLLAAITGAIPAASAFRLRIVDALGRR
jgi:putative ABC transport system permease protein